ncbi:MAG: UDP-glucose 4-epimerase GalE [Clostridia bacterium]|nr:UDP-glucose 4-epimerase GalE [Clostridia bacterium]
MAVLVTGGGGFIGSHTCVELLQNGFDIVVVDNFSNCNPKSLERVKELTGKDFPVYPCDIRDLDGLCKVFDNEKIDSVIHFAGLKAVGESTQIPMEYYDNNVVGTLNLCRVMAKYGCKKIVFSSSATVYGYDNPSPLVETMKTGGVTNPYGRTKLMIEEILKDIAASDDEWSIVLLRYFNPIGAHESGRIGENPNGIPNNLMPYITQVAVGKREFLSVFGGDYDTPDGTGVRDYIHVVDLADGHIKALDVLNKKTGVAIYNLGTGNGYSVLDIVKAFEKASGNPLPYKIVDRRPGDIDVCYSNPEKAFKELGWKAKRGIEDMCADSWRWQSMNPNGYDD